MLCTFCEIIWYYPAAHCNKSSWCLFFHVPVALLPLESASPDWAHWSPSSAGIGADVFSLHWPAFRSGAPHSQFLPLIIVYTVSLTRQKAPDRYLSANPGMPVNIGLLLSLDTPSVLFLPFRIRCILSGKSQSVHDSGQQPRSPGRQKHKGKIIAIGGRRSGTNYVCWATIENNKYLYCESASAGIYKVIIMAFY